MPYSDYLPAKAVTWLQKKIGGAFLSGLGSVLDDFAFQATQATQARMPTIAPADALPVIGDERGLPQGPFESNADYAADLQGAWAKWVQGGTALGLLKELYRVGYQNRIYIVCQNGSGAYLGSLGQLERLTLPSSSWLIHQFNRNIANRQAGPGDPWSWFQIFMDYADGLPISPPAPSSWASGMPAGNSPEIAALIALIKRWTPAHMNFGGIIVLTSGMCVGFDHGVFGSFFARPISFYAGQPLSALGGTVTGYAP